MFLELRHTRLDVFKISKELIVSCYKETKSFPSEEKFGITQQIRRAAVSVLLNIAEGCSRKSIAERKRFFEIARGSVVEIDTAFDIAISLGYVLKEGLSNLGNLIIRSFQLLSKLIVAPLTHD